MAIGAVSTLQTGCNVVGSLAFAQLYAATAKWSPPFVYYVNSACNLLALIFALTLPGLDDAAEEAHEPTTKAEIEAAQLGVPLKARRRRRESAGGGLAEPLAAEPRRGSHPYTLSLQGS